MQNAGEELVGEYLKWCRGCQFVEYNLSIKDIQGEIDVIGLNLKKREVYVCEVAIHLETGLQYVNSKTSQPNNVIKISAKFSKDYEYVQKYLKDFKPVLMLWSPIVRNQKEMAKNNQKKDLSEINTAMKAKYGVEIEMIVNRRFQECLDELRVVAKRETQELKSPVLRMLQIDEKLKRHLEK